MEASKSTLNGIFNGNRKLIIPFFQRSYVWDSKQWERFLADMEMLSSKKEPYFLGSVILKQQPTSSNTLVGDTRTLIDGQQRLTTLNIFFKVLYLKLDKNSSFNRLFRLDIDDEPLALEHNYNDISAFNEILGFTSLDNTVDGKKNSIYGAYEFFKHNIDVDKLDAQVIKDNIMFVAIDLGEKEDEQQIFDTINSLGVRLTTAELLKNYFFNNKNDEKKFISYWKNIFEAENKLFWDEEIVTGRVSRTMIDLFFHSFLQIKIQDPNLNVPFEYKQEFARVDGLFNSYKTFIEKFNIDKNSLLIEIKDYASKFIEFDFDCIKKSLSGESGIERINNIIFGLDQSTLIPYILYLLKNVEDELERNKIFDLLECYILRRIITKKVNKNYNNLFTQLISSGINSKDKLYEKLEDKSDTTTSIPSDNELEIGFKSSYLTNSQARGVLYLLESKNRNGKNSTDILGMSKYSLEHLMPKNWRKHWDKPKDEDVRDQKLLTLGNLAIISQSLNSSIRDSEWKSKLTGKKDDGLKAYAKGIETLGKYLELDEWNEDEIDKRADDLYQLAVKTWKI